MARAFEPLSSHESIRLILGDNRWVEAQLVRVRWVLTPLIAVVTVALPIDSDSKIGLFAVLVASALYNAALHFWAVRRWAHRRLGYLTTLADASLISAGIAVTGGLESQFWGAMYLSVITVAIRYGARGTLAISVYIAAVYAAIVFPGGDFAAVGSQYAIRVSLLGAAGVFAGLLAEQAWTSYARLTEQLRRSNALVSANAAITPTLEEREIMRRAAREAVELVHGSAAVVLVTGVPDPEWYVDPHAPVETGAAFAEIVAEFDDLSADQRAVRLVEPALSGPAVFGSMLVACLQSHAGPIGRLVTARSAQADAFDDIDIEAVGVLAQRAGLAIDIAQLYIELRSQLVEVERAQAQAMQAAKLAAIGELAANVAHELNNPLTGVLMHLGLLAELPELGGDVRKNLDVMENEVVRMRGIVRDLLDFARKSEARVAPADIGEILRSSLTLVSHRREMRTLEVQWDLPPDVPSVAIDPNQFKQVFVNLFNNAIDAMGDEGRLSVRVRAETDDVRVDVIDTGPGISPEGLERVFDPFYTTKARGVGTGLGLSVTHGIVTNHGGSISGSSTLGEGTVFTVRVPMYAAVASEVGNGR